MSEFENDLKYSEEQRQKLKDFYSIKAYEGRYIFVNKECSDISKILQENAVDTILQLSDKKEIYIEEKIVRWKGKKYTGFTLETESCTVEGHEKDGWMKYGKFDYLLYGFTQENKSIIIYIIPFQKLKVWFWDNYDKYPITVTEQINKTKCRIVDIKDVKKYVGFKIFKIDDFDNG